MNSETPDNPWETAVTLAFRPRLLLQGVVEYLLAWSFTRGWWRLLLVNALPLLLLLSCAGLVGWGASLGRVTLVTRYNRWVAAEVPEALRKLDESSDTVGPSGSDDQPASATATDSGEATPSESESEKETESEAEAKVAADEQPVSRRGELLLRRLLQLQDSNSWVTYLVADQLARQDRRGQARQMMRRIAPLDSSGFPPAHAWLAMEQLRDKSLTSTGPADRERLLHDLNLATQWSGCPAGLVSLHAQMLDQAGDTAQAMAVLERAGAQQSSISVNLQIAELAAKRGQTGRLQRAAEAIQQEIDAKREHSAASASELAVLANVLLLQQNSAEARQVALDGLKVEPDHPQLRRMLSESYRLEYMQSITSAQGQTQVNLGLLDAALKADPSNPGVGTEIARLITAGQQATPELKAALEQQLAAGQSTALTHILLATRFLASDDLPSAEPHLELALRHAPNNPLVMNNLALVLARTKPSQLQRALELATAACQIAPGSGQYRDTLGEIRSLQGDKLGAIESYEAAIGLDPDLISPRQRLAELYQELGMNEMAAIQLRELQQRQKE